MNRLNTGEKVFKTIAYVLVIVFALLCLFPLIYAVLVSVSGRTSFNLGKIDFTDMQFETYLVIVKERSFWASYTNTIFLTIYGTAFSMLISVFAAYALTRKNLAGRNKFSFMIVFTMWFSAGLIPTYANYKMLGVTNLWGFVIGFGAQAFNIMLLRNAFNGVSSEIEEAARVDGANEFQILTSIYLPMSKSAIATVTLFYALNRWNGYYWANQLLAGDYQPLQAFLQKFLGDEHAEVNLDAFDPQSLKYAAIILSVIPIIVVYPYLQKFFSQGVNVGGVKE